MEKTGAGRTSAETFIDSSSQAAEGIDTTSLQQRASILRWLHVGTRCVLHVDVLEKGSQDMPRVSFVEHLERLGHPRIAVS